MNIFELILLAIGLAMDAFAVSMTNGMCYQKLKPVKFASIGIAFGLFQGIMPIIGYYAGSLFTKQISAFDHWLALILLGFIGGKMLYDGIKSDDEKVCCKEFKYSTLLIQAIATSIDALAVGISFAAVNTNIYVASSLIAIITCVISFIGIILGRKLGTKLNSKAQIFGGVILICIGLKIFIEHTFF